MKDAALILNPVYKDQVVQTNISYDQKRGHFTSEDNPRASKYQYCQYIDPFRAHNNGPCTCYHIPQLRQI